MSQTKFFESTDKVFESIHNLNKLYEIKQSCNCSRVITFFHLHWPF